MKVVTLTANPLLDKFLHLDHLESGKSHRAKSVQALAGGKGINVARQLTRLGIETIATGFIGGATGGMLKDILDSEGIYHSFVKISKPTREAFTMIDADGKMTIVFEPAPIVTKEEAMTLQAKLKELLKHGDWLVFSGSVTNSEIDTLYSDLIHWAREADVRTFLDSYGEPLKYGLRARPDVVKVNDEELGAFLGKSLLEDEACIQAVKEVVSAYGTNIILTRGGKDFFAATKAGAWRIHPPSIEFVNALGSGDSMAAGIVYGLMQGRDFESILQWGAAAGAANAQKITVAASSLAEIKALVEKVEVEKIG